MKTIVRIIIVCLFVVFQINSCIASDRRIEKSRNDISTSRVESTNLFFPPGFGFVQNDHSIQSNSFNTLNRKTNTSRYFFHGFVNGAVPLGTSEFEEKYRMGFGGGGEIWHSPGKKMDVGLGFACIHFNSNLEWYQTYILNLYANLKEHDASSTSTGGGMNMYYFTVRIRYPVLTVLKEGWESRMIRLSGIAGFGYYMINRDPVHVDLYMDQVLWKEFEEKLETGNNLGFNLGIVVETGLSERIKLTFQAEYYCVFAGKEDKINVFTNKVEEVAWKTSFINACLGLRIPLQ